METIVIPKGIRQESVGWSIALSVLLILAGLVAVFAPFVAGLAVTAIIAWAILLGGVAHLVFAWHLRHAGGMLWEILVGVFYVALSVFLLAHPMAGLVTITILLATYLLLKGIAELIGWFSVRGVAGGGWLLFDGVFSVLIAGMIWAHLPFSAAWVPGTLLGIAILFSGFSRLAISLAARRSHLLAV